MTASTLGPRKISGCYLGSALWRALTAGLCFGCAIDISAESAHQSNPDVSVPAIQKCEPRLQGVDTIEGRLDSARLPDGRLLLVAGAATIGTQTTNAGILVTRSGDCPRAESLLAAQIIDVTPLTNDLQAVPLAVLTTDPVYAYFSTLHADGTPGDGIGIARYEPSAGKFKALGWLWTRDRPGYGSAAVLQGNVVYVFGGKDARFLSADIYVARVSLAQIDQPAAYEYWEGGGNWASDADLAAPLVEGGVHPSVAWNSVHQRWLMAYATPLARQITVRTGLDVKGPWSAPVPFAACDLPANDDQTFCDDIVLHPLLSEPGDVVVSHGVRSFDRSARAALEDYETRILYAAWPVELP
jgi:hypothetical protein